MEFQNYVTEYFDRRAEEDPASVFDQDMQMLIDLSRQQDLQERSTENLSAGIADENTDGVEQEELTPSSLDGQQEPATDSAILNQQESGPEIPDNEFTPLPPKVDAEPAQFESRVRESTEPASITQYDESMKLEIEANQRPKDDQLENELNDPEELPKVEPIEPKQVESEETPVPGTEFSERRQDDFTNDGFRPTDKYVEVRERDVEALRNQLDDDDDIAGRQSPEKAEMTELERITDPEPDIDIGKRFEQFIPEDFPLDFNEALLHVEQELLDDKDLVEIVEPGFNVPDLLEIPQFVYSTDSKISRVSRHMMERERLS